MKLLYAEDEPAMSEAVVDILTYHKYSVDPVYDGDTALDYALNGQYDGIILDIMMPGLSGLEVLRQLRSAGCRTPALLLTAKAEIEDQVQGLDLGAGDYLPKPFPMELLLARVRALLRRREEYTPNLLRCGNVTLDQKSCELSCNGQSFVLPRLEYQLMELLMLNQNLVIPKESLLVKIWGYESDAEDNNVEVYVSFLRKKLAHLHAKVKIRTIRMVGYCLEAEPL